MSVERVGETWPEAISDGLTMPCADCGGVPRFDYHVTPEFWSRWVTGAERTGVICLPCLDRRSGGAGLAEALVSIQWTGTGHTVLLRPTRRIEYAPWRDISSESGPAQSGAAATPGIPAALANIRAVHYQARDRRRPKAGPA